MKDDDDDDDEDNDSPCRSRELVWIIIIGTRLPEPQILFTNLYTDSVRDSVLSQSTRAAFPELSPKFTLREVSIEISLANESKSLISPAHT